MPADRKTLRDYQLDCIEQLRDGMRRGHRRQILCAPTGSGKTIIAIEMIEQAIAKGARRVAFIADRIALVKQTSQRLWEADVMHGVIQGGNSFRRMEKVLVCSAQTLEKRGYWDKIDLAIIDEAHTRRVSTEKTLMANDIPAIGLTATPFTAGLGKVYTNIVNARATYELMSDGWLVPPKVFCATEIDMTGAKVSMGEWSDREVEQRATTIVGDIVSEWIAHTAKVFDGPVKTLVFTPTIAYGEKLCEQFQEAGFDFRQVCYDDNHSVRGGNIQAFREGNIMGLVSCEALAKGFDVPDALCLISARPYRKSLAGHIQQVGRVLRSSPGKEFGLILDHAGNYLRFAGVREEFWANGCTELDDGTKKEIVKPPQADDETLERKCYNCGFVMEKGSRQCEQCGAEVKRRVPDRTEESPGEMVEYSHLDECVGDLWPHICNIALRKHPVDRLRARKFALAQHKNLTGKWPAKGIEMNPADECDPRVEIAVNKSVVAWIAKQRRQTYARRKTK